MRITRVEPENKSRYRIWLNDEPAFRLYKAEVLEYGIQEGKELSQEMQEEICSAVLLRRAKLRCLHLLERIDRTEYQLRSKLKQEEYPDPVAEEAIAYVKSYRYVDDFRYALNYIESQKERKSRQQILFELRNRGISGETAAAAFEESEPVDVKAQILRLAEKKRFDLHSQDPISRQKFCQFLLRKGFSYSDIKKALT